MPFTAAAFPILPGKTDHWRAWTEELNGPRREAATTVHGIDPSHAPTRSPSQLGVDTDQAVILAT